MMIISTIQKICLFSLSYCSLSITHTFASILAILLYSKESKKYLVTQKNLSMCFPNKTNDWVNTMTKNSLKEYLKSLLETPYIYRKANKHMNRLISKVHSENIIHDAIEEGKGIIFMTPHYGSWELSGLFAASKIKTYNMYKPLRNNVLNEYVLSGRQSTGSNLVATDNAGVKALLKALKNNHGIGILPDHTPKINQGVMSSFFGIPVNTTTLLYKLGKKNKVPIIYISSERLKSGKGFDIYIGRVDKIFYEHDEVKAADFLNKTLENLINKNVRQYLWSYERFRNRSGVTENIYK